MARWIVFDQSTAAELRSRLPNQPVFEAPGRTAIEYALTAPRTVVAAMGETENSESVIAVFRPGRLYVAPEPRVSVPVSPPATPSVRASGFLGLSDHLIVDEEETVAEKKRWWQFWR